MRRTYSLRTKFFTCLGIASIAITSSWPRLCPFLMESPRSLSSTYAHRICNRAPLPERKTLRFLKRPPIKLTYLYTKCTLLLTCLHLRLVVRNQNKAFLARSTTAPPGKIYSSFPFVTSPVTIDVLSGAYIRMDYSGPMKSDVMVKADRSLLRMTASYPPTRASRTFPLISIFVTTTAILICHSRCAFVIPITWKAALATMPS